MHGGPARGPEVTPVARETQEPERTATPAAADDLGKVPRENEGDDAGPHLKERDEEKRRRGEEEKGIIKFLRIKLIIEKTQHTVLHSGLTPSITWYTYDR